jgi:hypothetical protein
MGYGGLGAGVADILDWLHWYTGTACTDRAFLAIFLTEFTKDAE